ncbi:hypothetical protein BKI52_33315 [marine bacterium AO1-C]|nr:hypothetical protein BKI52_33315 [marine bacterium AO1-C]
MPRPKTKTELEELSQKNYDRLINFIDTFSPEKQQQTFPDGYLNRNIRDVLGHLHHWHLMMISWYEVGMQGQKPPMPAEGYTWKTTSDLNKVIQQKYAATPLTEIRQLFAASHTRVLQLIAQHSNEELFEKKRYHWTGSTSLGAYLISATSSHYDWAFKLIKKCTK